MEEKFYWFMFCYTWRANGQNGNGSKILRSDSDQILSSDINDAVGLCKEFVGEQMHHNKESIQIIFTNIIKLAHCTNSEFHKEDDD